jgi:hypothetical protein
MKAGATFPLIDKALLQRYLARLVGREVECVVTQIVSAFQSGRKSSARVSYKFKDLQVW